MVKALMSVSVAIVCGSHVLGDDLDALAAAWERNCNSIADLEVRFEQVWTQTRGPDAERQVPRAEYLYRWRSDGLLYWKGVFPGSTAAETEVSYDCAMNLGKRRVRPGVAVVGSRNYAVGGGTAWALYSLRSPYPRESGEWSERCDLSALLSRPDAALRPVGEVVDGRPCVVVELPERQATPAMTLWLDPERNAAPLQWTMSWAAGRTTTAKLSGYVNLMGCWLPTVIGLDHNGESVIRVAMAAAGPDIRVNCGLTESECSVTLPKRGVVNEDTREFVAVDMPVDTAARFARPPWPTARSPIPRTGGESQSPCPSPGAGAGSASPIRSLRSGP